jgi:hypothetical protein
MGKDKANNRENKENRESALLMTTMGLLSGVEGAHFFSARLPSKLTIMKFVEDEEDRQNIISAIWESVGLSLGLGAVVSGVSYMAKQRYWWIPFAINAALTTGMALLYWSDIQRAMAKAQQGEGPVYEYTG